MFEDCVRERTGKETCLVGRRGPLFSAKLTAIETLEDHNLPQARTLKDFPFLEAA